MQRIMKSYWQARQGETGGHMGLVLLFSLTLAVMVLGVLFMYPPKAPHWSAPFLPLPWSVSESHH